MKWVLRNSLGQISKAQKTLTCIITNYLLTKFRWKLNPYPLGMWVCFCSLIISSLVMPALLLAYGIWRFGQWDFMNITNEKVVVGSNCVIKELKCPSYIWTILDHFVTWNYCFWILAGFFWGRDIKLLINIATTWQKAPLHIVSSFTPYYYLPLVKFLLH